MRQGAPMTGHNSSLVRVLIADDHRLFAEALEAILATEERITVVGRAADGFEAVELARTLRAAGRRDSRGRRLSRCYLSRAMIAAAAVFHVLVSVALLTLILMHSGRDA